MSQKALRPPLKWAGGKRWLLGRHHNILSNLASARVVEPFAGGLALSFGLRSTHVLASDINPHLMNFYQQVQKGGFDIPQLVRSKDLYYSLRDEFNGLIASKTVLSYRGAQLFWLLNRMGFNGLCRFNLEGRYNTPCGNTYGAITIPCWQDYEQLFAHWSFHTGSYDEIAVEDNDFLFCDPPYDQAWQGYYDLHFTMTQQENLAKWLKKFPGKGMIMNHATSRIVELYKDYGFEITLVQAPRKISADANNRKDTQEVIASHHFSWKDQLRSV